MFIMDKPDYKFRLTDFIPNNIGTLNYLNRNQNDDIGNGEKLVVRAFGLYSANAILFVGITGLAVWKGLELLLDK